MNSVIQLLTLKHLNKAISLVEDCMDMHGPRQSSEPSPNRRELSEFIKGNSLYGLFLENELVALLHIGNTGSFDNNIKWKDDEGESMFLEGILVHPTKRRQGIADDLLNFAEKIALEKGVTSIRLVEDSTNTKALKLYSQREYIRCGSSILKGHPVYYLEKILSFTSSRVSGWSS